MSDKDTKDKADLLNKASQVSKQNQTFYEIEKLFDQHWNIIQEAVKANVIEQLKTWISRVFTYQFDFNKITFDNLNEKQNDYIVEYNFFHSMLNKHLIASRTKVDLGKVAIALRVGTKLVPEVLEVMAQPKYKNGEMVECFATKNYITQSEQQDEITYFHFYKNSSGVYVDTYVSAYTSSIKNEPMIVISERTSSYTYEEINYLPIEIFKSNETTTPDWEFVKNSINFVANFTEQIIIEWKYIRTSFINNMNNNPDRTGAELQDDVENQNKRFFDAYQPDGTLNQSLAFLSTGGVTTDIARGIVAHFKDEILQTGFMISQAGGKNNKHTSEAMSANIDAFNYIWQRKILLNEDIARLYFKILDMSNKYGYAQIGKLPRFLKGDIQLARPLEMLLNLNAEGEELDNPTQTQIQINEEQAGVKT